MKRNGLAAITLSTGAYADVATGAVDIDAYGGAVSTITMLLEIGHAHDVEAGSVLRSILTTALIRKLVSPKEVREMGNLVLENYEDLKEDLEDDA